MISVAPAAKQALDEWLAIKTSIEARSEKTAQAYHGDVLDFLGFMGQHHGGQCGLKTLTESVHQRRSLADGADPSEQYQPHSLARKLSAVKVSTAGWHSGKVLMPVIYPLALKFQAKLPRPLSPEASEQMIEHVEFHRSPLGLRRGIRLLLPFFMDAVCAFQALSLKGRCTAARAAYFGQRRQRAPCPGY